MKKDTLRAAEKTELRELLKSSLESGQSPELLERECEYLLKAIDHMENDKKLEDVNPFDLSDIAIYNRKKRKP